MTTEERPDRIVETEDYQPEPEQLTEGRNVGLTFRNLKLSGFQRQLITGNRCEAFLDMKCVFHPDSTDIYYDTERFVRLDEVLRSGMTELNTVLIVCREFLEALKICEDYLLSTADLSFRDEHLFCTGDITTVKFMYVPGYQNHMSIREKLVDIVDTVIEYDEGEDLKISCLSDYKNRLYMGSQDLRALSILTEDIIRKNGPDQRRFMTDPEQNIEVPENRRREKGNPVRFTVQDHSPFRKPDNGKNVSALQEEGKKYGNNEDKQQNPSKIGSKLKHLFSELVT